MLSSTYTHTIQISKNILPFYTYLTFLDKIPSLLHPSYISLKVVIKIKERNFTASLLHIINRMKKLKTKHLRLLHNY